jgi:hypothetical protein
MLNPVYGRRDEGIWTDYGADWAAHGVGEFIEHYTDGPEVYDDGIRAFAQTIYSNALAKNGGEWFIDKTPRYLLIVDDLLRIFPQAKFIFLLRNPLSVLSSIVNTQINHDLTTLERFGYELLDGPAAIINGMQQLGDQAIVVRYEEFVQSPDESTRTICNAIGLDYQLGMVDYSDREPIKGFMQDRTGIQKHSRPSDTRIQSWRQLLEDAQQLHFAESYLAELGRETIEQLGYSFDELAEAVTAAKQTTTGKVTLPWFSALAEPRFTHGLDHLSVDLYRNIRDHGPVVGRMMTVRDFFKSFIVQMKWIFSRSKEFRRK